MYLPLTSKLQSIAPPQVGARSSGFYKVLSPYTQAVSSRVPLCIPRDGGGHVPLPEQIFKTLGGFPVLLFMRDIEY